jgi:hypothetical protein
MSSRISSKEQECASRVVEDICRILCSAINRSVCTLYWNKNYSTFLKINGAFYYKIKSCALVGTLYTGDFGKLLLSRDNCWLLRNKFLNTGQGQPNIQLLRKFYYKRKSIFHTKHIKHKVCVSFFSTVLI